MKISGKVIDRFTRQALDGVALSIEYQGKKLLEQTNQFNGSFTIELILSEAQQQKLAAPFNLVAKKEGYKPESVELNPQIEQQQLTIALEEETFEVRGKVVDAATKLPLSEVQFMFRVGEIGVKIIPTGEELVDSQNPEAEEWVDMGSAVDFTAVIPADRAELSRETEREKIERYRSYLYTLERRLMRARR